ncbi:MAG: BON domain-containing protein [Gammaproteobacteria bacterium]|nr:BON domain-containing protein [Gammaproteobacteria bacterium]
MAIGGAAAGGYVVGKDERKVGQVINDGTITAAVKTKLIRSKYIDAGQVDVDVYQGVVTLTGNVGSYLAREQATELAEQTRGVTAVENNLNVRIQATE